MYKDNELYEINIDKLAYSLENNSNIKVSDYMIPIESRYHLLSLEHDRIHNEINSEINKIINFDFNRYSTENFKENLAKFWDWVKKMFDKFINWVQVFIKRIIAKIYEITLIFSKKESLYQKFNNKVFTSVDIQIKDRKLNQNIIEFIDEYVNMTNKWVEQIRFDSDGIKYDKVKYLTDTLYEMEEIIDKNGDTKSINEYVDRIFYSNNKVQDTTIRNYFGCNVGETPKAIIILSDKYTKKLVENKKALEKWLEKLKKYRDILIKQVSEEQKLEYAKDEYVNTVKKILTYINYFNNMNYSFFINAVNVRKKVAKYIAMDCLGKKIIEQIVAGVHSGKPFKINTYYGMDFEQFKDVADDLQIINTEKGATIKVIQNSEYHCIFVFVKTNNDVVLKDKLEKYKKMYKISIFFPQAIPINERISGKHFYIFSEYQNIFKLKTDITKLSTILINGEVERFFPLKTYSLELSNFEKEYGKCDFSYFIAITNERYTTREDTQLFHTSKDDLKFCSGVDRGAYLYPEYRIYHGANIPMTSDGKIFKGVMNRKIYLMTGIPSNTTIYRDPEYVLKRNYDKDSLIAMKMTEKQMIEESDRTACFIITNKVELEDVTDIFKSNKEYM